MSLPAYDGGWVSPHLERYGERGLLGYVGTVGSNREPGSAKRLESYVQQFTNRKPFDNSRVFR
jgi:hypothetical protein